MAITVKAYAKINLSLDVTGRRGDGYHLLKMIMQSVSLHDLVTVDTVAESGRITITCSDPSIPCDRRNIAYRSAEAFFKASGLENTGIAIHIEKRIPSEAGLAGGSADGAAVLLALDALFGTQLSDGQLCRAGASVGADIPFCLTGGTMLVEGIGDILTRLPDMPDCPILLAKPSWGISTAEAYARIDAGGGYTHPDVDAMADAIKKGDVSRTASLVSNIFEQTGTFEPVDRLKEHMLSHGALGSAMTGSGSAVFGIFNDEASCVSCRDSLGGDVWSTVCKTVNKGCELTGH